MAKTTKSSTPKAWSKAIIPPAREFPQTPLEVLSGQIPEDLQGTLYRNGPARLERGNKRVGHWFDGDGAILAVQFGNSVATGVYRYVNTWGYQEEEKANQYLFPNYGMTASGGFWNNWTRPIKNAANTSVLALPDRLLALWEGGNPHGLDLQTLETFGTDQLSTLEAEQPYSAHPKVDPETGEIYNFGVTSGKDVKLNVYKSDPTGKIIQSNSLSLSALPIIHDFVLAGQYLVFFVAPVRVNILKILSGLFSYSSAMEWKPEEGTEVIVIDRDSLNVVSRDKTDPWYQWHFANGFVNEEGLIVVESAAYEDFQTNQRLKEVPTGKMETPACANLWNVWVDPQTAKVVKREKLMDADCEFPVVRDAEVGKPWRYTYLATHREGANTTEEMYGAIARYDRHTQKLEVADCGGNRYPSEPLLAGNDPDPQWLITVVYDGNLDQSQVWIFDRDRLKEEPVCRLKLPSVVPPSFHGSWAN